MSGEPGVPLAESPAWSVARCALKLTHAELELIANPASGSSAFYKALYSYVFTTGSSYGTTGTLWGYQGFAGNSCGGGISVGILLGIDGYALLGLLFSEANNTATDLYGARGTADAHSSNTGTVASNLMEYMHGQNNVEREL